MCQRNNLVSLFMWLHVIPLRACVCTGERDQISGSTTTLDYIHAANLPSVRKNLLFNPSQHPLSLPPPPSHVTKWSCFALAWSNSTGRWIANVRKADLFRWADKYGRKPNENRHWYFRLFHFGFPNPTLDLCSVWRCWPLHRAACFYQHASVKSGLNIWLNLQLN